MMQTDLLIIGAGPGGYRAAEYACQQGLQVVIVEQEEVGGTCLNRGCIPTKTYVHSATFDEAVTRQQQVVAQLRSGVEGILSAPGITLLRGHASFQDSQSVVVERAADGSVVCVTFKAVIIATGSKAKMPPIADIDDPRVVTSTELLRATSLPRRLCIIGAGVIGMEFASVFHRFGSEVVVVEFLKECLPMLDSDVAKRLRKLMEKRGITFRMKTAVQQLADIDADTILIATGRQANTDGLNLQAAGITPDARGFIVVDDHFQVLSSLHPHCYAIGDVNGRQLLAHAAEMQAVRAVNHLMGRSDGIRFDIMPAAIFTEPEAACVGPSEDQLKTSDSASGYRCLKSFWRANGKALAMGQTEGMLKLFADADDRILGCHAFGAHAADIVQEVSVLMCRDTTVGQLRDMVHIHPTLSEILRDAR
jgi:dihydrolipoamide dehydrogenase